jgi:hypothetical protein
MLSPIFKPFVEQSPISVMARGMMERVLNPNQLNNGSIRQPMNNTPRICCSHRCLTL